jgi:hypothetical protein
VLIASSLAAHTQTKSDTSAHLIFKGVPIDGTAESFILKMKKAGFRHVGTEDGIAMLIGDFASYKSCSVGVFTLKPKNTVSKIGVIFSERETWSGLASNYFDLKEMLTEKYGDPAEVVEEFETTVKPNDDRSKMYEVMFDRCKYYTTFRTDKGTIQLSIEHDGATSCFVRLAYRDKINGVQVKKGALDDL